MNGAVGIFGLLVLIAAAVMAGWRTVFWAQRAGRRWWR